MSFGLDVVVVGGCGHVGLPLGIAFADRGLRTVVYDINDASVALVNGAHLPFEEPGALPVLEAVVASGALQASADPTSISKAEHVVVVIGTPVDEHLNPDARAVPDAVKALIPYLRAGPLIVPQQRPPNGPAVRAQQDRPVHLPAQAYTDHPPLRIRQHAPDRLHR